MHGQLTALVENGALALDSDRTPVPWWSFSKTVLAAGALVLVAKGKLDLDVRLRGRAFTLRQLLQHRAGMPDYGGLAEYQEAVARGDPPWAVETLLERVRADGLLFEPGQGWAYSNVGYLLVRELIENVTGQTVCVALQRLVFEPLGVSDARVALVPKDLDATAWGNPAGYDPGWVYHGLLVGSPASAALFLHRLLAGDLLSGAVLEEMTREHPLGFGPTPGRPWRKPAYGLGVMIDGRQGATRYIGHSGQGPGSCCAVYHCSDTRPGRTVAVFAAVEDQGDVEKRAVDLAQAGAPISSP